MEKSSYKKYQQITNEINFIRFFFYKCHSNFMEYRANILVDRIDYFFVNVPMISDLCCMFFHVTVDLGTKEMWKKNVEVQPKINGKVTGVIKIMFGMGVSNRRIIFFDLEYQQYWVYIHSLNSLFFLLFLLTSVWQN